MRKSVGLGLVALLFAIPSIQSQIVPSSPDELALRKIEAETAKLEQQNNHAIEKFLADDWVCAGSRALSKKEFIENVRRNFATHENGVNPYTIEKQNIQIHLFGDTAVVTYVKEYRQTPDTTRFFNEDDTDVFTRTPHGWLLRFTKISPVQSQSASN
ncbi:MAG TPA: nuclear transport factor 2 family protein [Candidatus Acidoferrum sp.]|nr:nuclear transport factor 2 family protein [Candidatus Acidoferrum sp.]